MPDGSIGSILVTGGASGLGSAVVDHVLESGGRPLVLDREPPARAVEHELVDLCDGRKAEAAVDRLASVAGLDAVVTCAGTDACGPLGETDPEAWERVVQVNLLGTAAVVRAALPHLTRSHGRIVTVGSTLGQRALPAATAYCASKFGVVGFTRALAAELAGQVGVTLLMPGGMDTAFFDGRDPEFQPPPDLQLNSPGNVAAAVIFALGQPPGCEIREITVTPSVEPSWP